MVIHLHHLMEVVEVDYFLNILILSHLNHHLHHLMEVVEVDYFLNIFLILSLHHHLHQMMEVVNLMEVVEVHHLMDYLHHHLHHLMEVVEVLTYSLRRLHLMTCWLESCDVVWRVTIQDSCAGEELSPVYNFWLLMLHIQTKDPSPSG